MSYKTILVYLSSSKQARGLMEVALVLAQQQGAHLIALHIVPQVTVPAILPIEATSDMVELQRRAFAEDSERIKHIFEEMTVSFASRELRIVTASHYDVAGIADLHCRAVDLVIAGQPESAANIYVPADITEDLMMESGRPVLIIPDAGIPADFGKRVLIAWNESREAARAVFEALPLLRAAENVRILSIDPPRHKKSDPDLPGSEIATALARHGVKCEAGLTQSPNLAIDAALKRCAADFGATLIVMGGYGHSWFRELVFGGATHDMLKNLSVPVLIAH